MKKILIVFLVFGLFFLSGCTNTEQLSQSELFDKKQECANMKTTIQSEQNQGIIVSEVFYNQKMNTCLYVLQGNGAKLVIDRFGDEFKGLYNADSEIFCNNSFGDIDNNEGKDALKKCLKESKEFDEKLKELKGE